MRAVTKISPKKKGTLSNKLSDFSIDERYSLGGKKTTTDPSQSGKFTIDDLHSFIKQVQEKQETYSNAIDEALNNIYSEIGNFETISQKSQNEINILKRDKIELISLLGIFVSIFTFVSVEIRILQTVNNIFQIAGLTIIMFSGIILFALLIHLISNQWIHGEYKKIPWPFLSMVIIALFLGLGIIAYSYYIPHSENLEIEKIKNQIEKLEITNEIILKQSPYDDKIDVNLNFENLEKKD